MKLTINLNDSLNRKLDFAIVEAGRKKGEFTEAAIARSLKDKEFLEEQKQISLKKKEKSETKNPK